MVDGRCRLTNEFAGVHSHAKELMLLNFIRYDTHHDYIRFSGVVMTNHVAEVA